MAWLMMENYLDNLYFVTSLWWRLESWNEFKKKNCQFPENHLSLAVVGGGLGRAGRAVSIYLVAVSLDVGVKQIGVPRWQSWQAHRRPVTCHPTLSAQTPGAAGPDILGGRPGEQTAHTDPGHRQVIMRLTDRERTPPPLDDTELWHCHTSDNRKLSQILCLLLCPPLTRHRWPVTTNSQSVKEKRREILMFISPSGEMEILSLYNCQLTFIRLQCPTINIVYNSKI